MAGFCEPKGITGRTIIMMMNKFIFTLVLLALSPVFLGSSCNHKEAGSKGCPPDVVCTMMYAMITVAITDEAGKPVVLDEYYTLRPSVGDTLRPPQSMEGTYVVLDDSYQKKLQQQQDEFFFVGYKDGRQVVNEPYTLGADCCHVKKLKGRDQIPL